MKKIKGLEYQSPNEGAKKKVSVFFPVLILIGLTIFFVVASNVKGFQLFEILPTPQVRVEVVATAEESPISPDSEALVLPGAQVEEATEVVPLNIQPPSAIETTPEPIIIEEPKLKGLEESLFETLASTEGVWSAREWAIDQVEYNQDGDQALVWLAGVDPETGMVMASEPIQVFAQKSDDQASWTITLEDDPAFAKLISISDLAESEAVSKSAPPAIIQADVPRIYGGYYLPWEAGLRKALTWSIAHTSCTPTYYCKYAFDFADGTMFKLSAAKPGTVYHWKDTCANGVTNCTNSITLEDRSTEPWTYQIYLHLANNSIPSELKRVGAYVRQGQFIGLVDDTGASTGHHVHFMVVAKDTLYKTSSGYYFGRSEDITFRDVLINWDIATQGGRPRLAYEATTYGGVGQTWYISGNVFAGYKYIFPLFFN